MNDRLVMRGIEMGFFGVPVLKRVDLTVPAGQIVGLVGENGAGKSTLMNVLAGHHRAEAGTMHLDGKPWQPAGPREARARGIGFVHQELNLFPNLSLAENLCLDDLPRRGPFVHRRALHARAQRLLQRVGLSRAPTALAGDLTPGERQLLEIARALAAEPRLLVLDEPTTSLGRPECDRLFAVLDDLRSEGGSLIYISHALDDVLRLCDRLTVLRDGAVVADGPASGFDPARLVSLMAGRRIDEPASRTTAPLAAKPTAPPLLDVRGLSRASVVRGASLSLHHGEILGLSGLMGAGRTELARLIFGLDHADSGEVHLDGQPLTGGPRARLRAGLAFVTESRRDDGLCLDASVADNMTLAALPQFARTPLRFLPVTELRQNVAALRESVRLQPRLRDDQEVRTLSGGNQQKVVLAKWFLRRPCVLLLDEPTRGIDHGAKQDVYEWIQRVAGDGAGILLISSELEELMALCDRILVMARGRVTSAFSRSEFHPERLLAAAFAGHGSTPDTRTP